MNDVCVDELVFAYKDKNPTIKELAEEFGISAGKAYYILRDAGCEFNRRRRHPRSDEYRKKLSAAATGRKNPKLAEANRLRVSNYNGLNGYGHTKKHCMGYVLAYAPKHPKAHKDGYVMMHTIVMERHIGRYLKQDEVVHHINHKRDDNRLENLALMNIHEHASMHMNERYAEREE